ncbi:invasion associated locus B family protein [Bradyrhizobium sp. CCBAU 53340]|uniref:invasion associated locus B family protein n=1 Tax=Bradyrhizobium sp. CCBAU 53340 TaxID=1325112 RepID=UPI00188AFADE|nr:invasion associated locus B family protein [Bradyrhizobium sp. CCBAU 53340]QOZ48616.1 invasion associated locus B family protein [Bradyrhizobium sp. CCBAU 53340]
MHLSDHNSACRWVCSAWLAASALTAPVFAEIAPRGQRSTVDIKYGEWKKLCFKAAGPPLLCRTSISGIYETGQMAVRIDLIEREKSGNARMQVFVPVGMYLRIPAKLKVDTGAYHPIPYSWCVSNGCIAGDVANSKLVKEMESGKTLTLEVVDSNLLSLTTSLPLAQFSTAHDGPPAQTLEQDIEE